MTHRERVLTALKRQPPDRVPVDLGGTQTGILVEPSDEQQIATCLRSLLLDPDLRQHYREAGLRQASRFSWEASARQVLSLYAELLP